MGIIMQTRRNRNRYARETGEVPARSMARFRSYLGKPGYFIHFSDYNKLGLNPTNKYDTPTGFYAYLSDKPISGFANDRSFAIVFRSTHNARLLDLATYSDEDLAADASKVTKWLSEKLRVGAVDGAARSKADSSSEATGVIGDAAARALVRTGAGRIWNVTRMAASYASGKGKSSAVAPNVWSGILRDVLGYDGVVDRCKSIIHGNEPCQAVFFDTSHYGGAGRFPKLELVEVIESRTGMGFIGLDKPVIVPGERYVDADFRGADFRGADFTNAEFLDCWFNGANLTGVNLTGVFFSGAMLNGANLTGANLKNARFEGSRLRGAKLAGASMDGTDMRKLDLRGADLSGARLKGVDLTGANLLKANLSRADLHRCVLARANLRGANLRDAKLYAAFVGADMTGADMTGADIDKSIGLK